MQKAIVTELVIGEYFTVFVSISTKYWHENGKRKMLESSTNSNKKSSKPPVLDDFEDLAQKMGFEPMRRFQTSYSLSRVI